MILKKWKELNNRERTMSEDYNVVDFETISLPKELYNKLSKIAEKIKKIRFQVGKKGEWYFKVTALKEEDQDNDFTGTFEGICAEEALLRVAKDGYGIEADEIEFVN
jgi:hypothetical protein